MFYLLFAFSRIIVTYDELDYVKRFHAVEEKN